VLLSFTRLIPPTNPTNADSVIFRATFDEAVTAVDSSDFAVNGTTSATVTNIVEFSPTEFDITISAGDLAGFNGAVGVNLAGAQNMTDVAGNALPAGDPAVDEVFTLDNTAPAVTSFERQTPSTALTSADAVTFRVTFNEAVANVSTGDFTVDGTSTAAPTAVQEVSPSVYDVTVSGGDLTDFNGTVGLDLAAGQDITDVAGNALPAGEPSTDETYNVVNGGTIVVVDQGDLKINDIDDKDDSIAILVDGTNLIITTGVGTISASAVPGVVGDATNSVSIPLASFAGDVIASLAGGADLFTANYSGGVFPFDITLSAGTGLDTLAMTSTESVDIVTHTYLNASDGSASVTDGNTISTLSYTGLAPIIDDLVATEREFRFTASTPETITYSDDGMAGNNIASIVSTMGEFTTFRVPTQRLLVDTNESEGSDRVNIEGQDSNTTANIVVSTTSLDQVHFQANTFNTGGGNLTATSGDVFVNVPINSLGGDIDLAGFQDVTVNALVSSADGNVSVEADFLPNGSGVLTVGSVNAGSGDVLLVGFDLVVEGQFVGTGNLSARPSTANRSIGINGPGDWSLTTAEIGFLTSNYVSTTVGDPVAGTGAVNVGAAAFTGSLAISGGFINVNDSLSSTGTLSLTARNATGDVDLNASIQATGNVTLLAGNDIRVDAAQNLTGLGDGETVSLIAGSFTRINESLTTHGADIFLEANDDDTVPNASDLHGGVYGGVDIFAPVSTRGTPGVAGNLTIFEDVKAGVIAVVNLQGNLLTDGGNVSIDAGVAGDDSTVVVGADVTIDTEVGGNGAAGSISILATNLDAMNSSARQLVLDAGGTIDAAINVTANIINRPAVPAEVPLHTLEIDGASTVNLQGITLAAGGTLLQIAGSGATTINGPVAAVFPIANVSLTTTGPIILNGGSVNTGGASQTYNAPVILGENTVLTGGNLTFNGTLNSQTGTTRNLDINSSGITQFNGIVGGTVRPNRVTVASTGTTVGVNAAINVGAGGFNIDPPDTVTIAAAINSNGGPVSIEANNGVTLTGATADVNTGGGAFTVDADADNDNTGAFSINDASGTVVVGAGNIAITASDVVLVGDLTGTGSVSFIPSTTARTIGLGGGGGDFNLNDADIGGLSNGFTSITIGDTANGTGTVNIESATNGTAGLVARGYVMRRLRVRPGVGVVVSSSGPEPSVCVC
jgi:hypothetical protein